MTFFFSCIENSSDISLPSILAGFRRSDLERWLAEDFGLRDELPSLNAQPCGSHIGNSQLSHYFSRIASNSKPKPNKITLPPLNGRTINSTEYILSSILSVPQVSPHFEQPRCDIIVPPVRRHLPDPITLSSKAPLPPSLFSYVSWWGLVACLLDSLVGEV